MVNNSVGDVRMNVHEAAALINSAQGSLGYLLTSGEMANLILDCFVDVKDSVAAQYLVSEAIILGLVK